jgi:hypothetical protein
MIGRADIEGSNGNVAMNAWLPQASSFIPSLLWPFRCQSHRTPRLRAGWAHIPQAGFPQGVGRTLRFRAHLTDRRDAQPQSLKRPPVALSPADQPYLTDYHLSGSATLTPGFSPGTLRYRQPNGSSQQPGVLPPPSTHQNVPSLTSKG